MEDKTITTHTPLTIILKFDEPEEIKNLYESEEFKTLIYVETEKALDFIVKNKPEKIDLFKLSNIGLMVSIPKEGYGDLFDKVTEYYSGKDNFEKCIELNKLKELL